MIHPDPIAPLAALIGSSPAECRANGLGWWLDRAIAARLPIQTMIALREIAALDLKGAKSFCMEVAVRAEGMREVVACLERGDVAEAARTLRRRYDMSFEQPRSAERLAVALARAFDLPGAEIVAAALPSVELERLAEGVGSSIDAARERGLVGWLEAAWERSPSPEYISFRPIHAVKSVAPSLSPSAITFVLSALRKDTARARRAVELPEGPELDGLIEDLAEASGRSSEETRTVVKALRAAFTS